MESVIVCGRGHGELSAQDLAFIAAMRARLVLLDVQQEIASWPTPTDGRAAARRVRVLCRRRPERVRHVEQRRPLRRVRSGEAVIVDLVLDAVAAYRLTRLVTADVLTQDLRDQCILAAYVAADRNEWAHEQIGDDPEPGAWQALVEADDRAPKLAELVTCRWCAGFWISAGVVLARTIAPRWWRPLSRALAFSAAAALLARLETD